MNNFIHYKGYTGSVEFSEEDEIFYGKVLGIRALILYEGNDAKNLVKDFRESIDEYIEMCKADGRETEKPYKGSFNVRISPVLHQEAALYALANDITLNRFVELAVSEKLQRV